MLLSHLFLTLDQKSTLFRANFAKNRKKMVHVRGLPQGPDAGARVVARVVVTVVVRPAVVVRTAVFRSAGPPDNPPVGASPPVLRLQRRSSPPPRQPRPPSHPPTKEAAKQKAVANAAAIAAGANDDVVEANDLEITRLQSENLALRTELEAANEAVEAAGARARSGKERDPDWGSGQKRQR